MIRSLHRKFIATAAIPLSILVVFGIYSIFHAQSTAQVVEKMYLHPLAVSNALRDIRINVLKMKSELDMAIMSDTKSSVQLHQDNIQKTLADSKNKFKLINERFLGDKTRVKEANQELIKISSIFSTIINSKLNGDDQIVKNVRKKNLEPQFIELSDKLSYLINFASNKADTFYNEATQSTTDSIIVKNCLLTLSCLFSFLFILFITRKVRNDFNEVIADLNESTRCIDETAHNATEVGESIRQASIEQSANLQQSVAAMNEIKSMVDKNTQATVRSKDFSEKSSQSVVNGQKRVQEMLSSIEAITSANNNISSEIEKNNTEINRIVTLMNDIDNKTQVINDIVFQTKLLSFNASVEAARAGEQGKGFAVVAQEIGNLATMSGNASEEIRELLENSKVTVHQIANDMQGKINKLMTKSVHEINQGKASAQNCHEVLEEISVNVNQVNGLISEIASASHEQSQGVQEVNTAMEALNASSNDYSKLSHNSLENASRLSVKTSELNNLVVRIESIINGKSHESSTIPSKEDLISESKTEVQADNVVTLSEIKKQEKSPLPPFEEKKVVNSGIEIPSADDPRFKEF